jgi:predicted DNA-binding protein (UPF0251 family)
MPRPRKCRRVAFFPQVTYFKPAGIPMKFLEEVHLSLEEVEAVRLRDIEDLDQEQCAVKMNVSRPTFQRVLESARKKIAEALLCGKAIIVEGGNFEVSPQRLRCAFGREWESMLSESETTSSQTCLACNSGYNEELQPVLSSRGRELQGRNGRHRAGNIATWESGLSNEHNR